MTDRYWKWTDNYSSGCVNIDDDSENKCNIEKIIKDKDAVKDVLNTINENISDDNKVSVENFTNDVTYFTQNRYMDMNMNMNMDMDKYIDRDEYENQLKILRLDCIASILFIIFFSYILKKYI